MPSGGRGLSLATAGHVIPILGGDTTPPGKAVVALNSVGNGQIVGKIAALPSDADLASVKPLYRIHADTNPNDWTAGTVISSPAVGGTFTISGLTNDVEYDIALVALDTSSNEGRVGNILRATPTATAEEDTDLDKSLVPLAVSLLARFGKKATYSTRTAETYTASTGENVQTYSNHVVKVSPPAVSTFGYAAGDLVQAGAIVCYLAASGLQFTPRMGDKLVIDSATWGVKEARPLRSGRQIAAWLLSLKEGSGA